MDMKKILSVISENPMPTPMSAPVPMPEPPVTMNMNLNAQGVDQIKDLLKLISSVAPEKEEAPEMPAVGLDMPIAVSSNDKKDSEPDMKDLMKLAGTPEKEEYANEPDEVVGDLDDVIRPGNDLHKEKRMFKKANGGDNAMAIESVRQLLDRRYKEIKEGKV